MLIILEADLVKKDSRFRVKGGQTSNLYTLGCLSQYNEDNCKKEIKEEVIIIEEKQRLNDYEEMETVNFLDYTASDDSIIEIIDDELLEGNNEVINYIQESNCKGDSSAIPVIEKFKLAYDIFNPKYYIMDSGYNYKNNYDYVTYECNANAIIAYNKRGGVILQQGFNEDFEPICILLRTGAKMMTI